MHYVFVLLVVYYMTSILVLGGICTDAFDKNIQPTSNINRTVQNPIVIIRKVSKSMTAAESCKVAISDCSYNTVKSDRHVRWKRPADRRFEFRTSTQRIVKAFLELEANS